MILGVSTQNWSDLSLIEQFREIAKHGFRYVNIHFDDECSKDKIQDALICFRQLNLISGQLSSSAFPKSYFKIHDYDSAVKTAEQLVDLQSDLGGKQIAVSAGTYSKKKAETIENSIKFMRKLCDYAKTYDQIIALSVLPNRNHLVNTWDKALDYYTKVDRDNFMININIAFQNYKKLPIRSIQLLKGKLPQCHIADNDSTKFNSDNHIGEGTADIRGWIKALRPLVEETCRAIKDTPAAVLLFHNADSNEVKRTLEYLEHILPKVRL